MYAGNTFSRRRPEGWAERRKYFRKLLQRTRPEGNGQAKEKDSVSSK